MQKKLFHHGKQVCVSRTWNLDTSAKFWGNFEGILGNPGEMPHIQCVIRGVYICLSSSVV